MRDKILGTLPTGPFKGTQASHIKLAVHSQGDFSPTLKSVFRYSLAWRALRTSIVLSGSRGMPPGELLLDGPDCGVE